MVPIRACDAVGPVDAKIVRLGAVGRAPDFLQELPWKLTLSASHNLRACRIWHLLARGGARGHGEVGRREPERDAGHPRRRAGAAAESSVAQRFGCATRVPTSGPRHTQGQRRTRRRANFPVQVGDVPDHRSRDVSRRDELSPTGKGRLLASCPRDSEPDPPDLDAKRAFGFRQLAAIDSWRRRRVPEDIAFSQLSAPYLSRILLWPKGAVLAPRAPAGSWGRGSLGRSVRSIRGGDLGPNI
jgi:hypothetical protein